MTYLAFISKTGTVHLAHDAGPSAYDTYSLCGRLLELAADRHGAEEEILDELSEGIPHREKPMPGSRVDLASLRDSHPEAKLCRTCAEQRGQGSGTSTWGAILARPEPSELGAILRTVEDAATAAGEDLHAKGLTDPHVHAALRQTADLMRLHQARIDGTDDVQR